MISFTYLAAYSRDRVETGWALGSVWAFWRRRKYLVLVGTRTAIPLCSRPLRGDCRGAVRYNVDSFPQMLCALLTRAVTVLQCVHTLMAIRCMVPASNTGKDTQVSATNI